MDKLEYKDSLNTAVYGAIQENQILLDYLSDIESYVVKFEQDKSHDNMVVLAYETAVLIERLSYLSGIILTKLMEIQALNAIDIEEVEADAEVHD